MRTAKAVLLVLVTVVLLGLTGSLLLAAGAPRVSLRGAVILTAGQAADPVELQAAQMLQEEAKKRTGLGWRQVTDPPAGDVPLVVVASRPRLSALVAAGSLAVPALPPAPAGKPAGDGYVLAVDTATRKAPTVFAIGNERRGTLFAVGRLLREMHMFPNAVEIEAGLRIATGPAYPIRGHQLGYRNSANAYDGWDLADYEQYIRDLAVFGANAIELIPIFDLNRPPSPVMPAPLLEMNIALTGLLAKYGIDVWLWIPVQQDISDPALRQQVLDARRELFRRSTRIDAIFVPGGDPGRTPPDKLMPFLGELTALLHQYHPNAQMWVSHQGFKGEKLTWFYNYLQTQQPDWLTGVIYGPWTHDTLAHTRQVVPAKYQIRRYPDTTHNVRCQYPAPDWDPALALTLGREAINPRPTQFAHVSRLYRDYADGVITYSDGVNDDVNKMVWSIMNWDPATDLRSALVEYGRYFIGEDYGEEVADGLLALEQNWVGPASENRTIDTTLALWQMLEQRAEPRVMANWRFQQFLLRAYYDAYTRNRLLYETDLEAQAMGALRPAPQIGAAAAMNQAAAILARATTDPVTPELRDRAWDLAYDLYASIRAQLSVPKLNASGGERGASLDYVDEPLNNREWLLNRFAALKASGAEQAKLDGLQAILNWEDPGPGGFYDDLGHVGRQPHLVRGPGWEQDPGYVESSQCEFSWMSYKGERLSWQDQAQTLYETPLRLHYEGLDPNAQYVLRVVYAGRYRATMTLEANGVQVHGPLGQLNPIAPQEFSIPRQATGSGILDLTWHRVTGRGCQVAEVWLLKR